MNVALWGVRGSLASPGPETARYGGNTSCVAVHGRDGTLLVLDAGTGIRALGASLPADLARVDLLLTHLHLDHIQGLGFWAPLFSPGTEVHVWGPPSTTLSLEERLLRYLSPPLFPVHLKEVVSPSRLILHDLPDHPFEIGEFEVCAELVCHPGPTVGYRITTDAAVLTYLPDHEPALGTRAFPLSADWTSGYALARDTDLLLHDAQYRGDEYARHVGWGHSTWEQALAFAELAGAKHLVLFHHDPGRSDGDLDALLREAQQAAPNLPVTAAAESVVFMLG